MQVARALFGTYLQILRQHIHDTAHTATCRAVRCVSSRSFEQSIPGDYLASFFGIADVVDDLPIPYTRSKSGFQVANRFSGVAGEALKSNTFALDSSV